MAVGKAGVLVDIILDGTGFMLLDSWKDNHPISQFSPNLSPAIHSGAASYSNTDPTREIPVVQNDWRRGAGQVNYKDASHRYAQSIGCDARFLDRLLLGPVVTTASTVQGGDPALDTIETMAVFNGKVYMGTSAALYQWDNGNSEWDKTPATSGTNPSSVTDIEVFTVSGVDYLYVARGVSTAYEELDTSDNWVTNTIGGNDKFAQYFKRVGDTFWKNETTTAIASSTNPRDGGSWSSTTTIGSVATVITDLLNHKNNLYVSKEDGWFDENDNSPVSLIPELSSLKNTGSGKRPLSWKGKAYAPFGQQAVYEYDDGNADYQTVSLGEFAQGIKEYGGQCLGMVADEAYIYAFFKNTDDTVIEVVAGRYETVEGETRWAWHPIARKTGTALKAALIETTQTQTKLWFVLTVSGTDTPYYITLPDKYADVENATNYLFLTGGTFITGFYDFGFPADLKSFASVTLFTKRLTANLTIKVEYKIDNDTSWTTLATWDANASPVETNYFPTGAPKQGRRIRFQFTLVTNSTASSPELVTFLVRGTVAFPVRRDYVLPIVIAEGQLNRQGNSKLEKTPQALEGALRTAEDKTWVELITLEENDSGKETETTHRVHITDIKEFWLKRERGSSKRYGQKLLIVTCSEVKLAA